MTMKKTAIVLAAAATFLTSISISAPATAASWDWGFSSPLFSYHHDRSVGSRHLSGRDSVRVGPWRWSGGFGVSADRNDRCAARYRSYDSVTGTYLTFGGVRKACRL
jgi:BA14K-like protein